MKKKQEQRKRMTVPLKEEMGEYIDSLKIAALRGDNKNYDSDSPLSKSLTVVWKRVAPSRYLEHTDNVVYSTRSKETEILVYTDNAAYAAELSMDKELYRIKMQEALGKEISDIKFLVSRKTAQRIKGRTN